MIVVPELTPETAPLDGLIVATPELALLHTPPVAASLNIIPEPEQTKDGPVIVPGEVEMVRVVVALVPHPVE